MKEERHYFRINPVPGMMFELEKVTVQGNRVVNVEKFDATYLQIILGNLYKQTLAEVNRRD